MNIRWLWYDYVDPALPLTLEQRLEISVRSKRMCSGREAVCMGAAVLTIILAWYWAGTPTSGSVWLDVALFVASLWVFSLVVVAYTRRPVVWQSLREFGYDVCPSCGYWLRGLDEKVERCPECGARR
jgi:hypothetical protein